MSLPQHYWLLPDEQAIMDTATGSASAYTHIALVKWTGLRKDRHKLVSGKVEAAPADFINASTLAPRITEEYDLMNAALVRLKSDQAALLSAAYPTAYVHPDPTGEQWGNLLIDQAVMKARQRTHLCNPHSNAKSIVWFGLHGRYGSTLESIGEAKARKGGEA